MLDIQQQIHHYFAQIRMTPEIGSTTKGRCHQDDYTPHELEAPLLLVEDIHRQRSMPDGGRRKPADAMRKHFLVGFLQVDSVQPSKTTVDRRKPTPCPRGHEFSIHYYCVL